MSDYKGEHYCFTTVDGFEVTETRSGRDSHGSQAIWTYFNGHLIANSDARQLEAELRCYPHKFVHSKDASSEHRFICSVCGRKTGILRHAGSTSNADGAAGSAIQAIHQVGVANMSYKAKK
mgnify:CR=1 FL=1